MIVLGRPLYPDKSYVRVSRSWSGHTLEPLELRSLLSAAIVVSGNGVNIASGDNKPSTLDFTDFRFMSTTVDATLGTVHRTFTITNSGDVNLALTGAGPVTLSGKNATDFSVAVQPATTIVSGSANAQTFTINFVPKGTGVRSAKVTIHTNDPAHKTFTFAIQGTGILTTNDSTNHLQTATVSQIKTGLSNNSLSATNQTDAYFDDIGVLTDGTVVFDSISDPSAEFVNLQLDVNGNINGTILLDNGSTSNTIQGWLLGLQGIKIGESRDLIVPTDLAFGNDTTSGIAANQTILFTVTCKPPTLTVQGLPTTTAPRVFAGDTTPSADDGTLFGTIGAGATAGTLTSGFALSQGGNGALNFVGNKPVSITGKDAKDFTFAFTDTNSAFSGINVIYQPQKPGMHTAIVNVKTTDPLHPTFSFTVSASEVGWHDLAVALGTVNFPGSGSITAGAATKYAFPVIVTNAGNLTVEANSKPLDVEIYLHNTTTDALTLISSAGLTTTAFRNLAAGKSKTLTLSMPIPNTVMPGTYDIQVKVDTQSLLNEQTLDNNVGTSSQLITVA